MGKIKGWTNIGGTPYGPSRITREVDFWMNTNTGDDYVVIYKNPDHYLLVSYDDRTGSEEVINAFSTLAEAKKHAAMYMRAYPNG